MNRLARRRGNNYWMGTQQIALARDAYSVSAPTAYLVQGALGTTAELVGVSSGRAHGNLSHLLTSFYIPSRTLRVTNHQAGQTRGHTRGLCLSKLTYKLLIGTSQLLHFVQQTKYLLPTLLIQQLHHKQLVTLPARDYDLIRIRPLQTVTYAIFLPLVHSIPRSTADKRRGCPSNHRTTVSTSRRASTSTTRSTTRVATTPVRAARRAS